MARIEAEREEALPQTLQRDAAANVRPESSMRACSYMRYRC